MGAKNKVVWSDGLFVKPHHFQVQSEFNEHYARSLMGATDAHPYGFVNLTINEELLTIGKIALTVAEGVMLDGTLFSSPQVDVAPPTLDLDDGFKANEIVYLCLPISDDANPEVQDQIEDGAKVSARFLRDEIVVRDRSERGGELAAVKVAKSMPRLKLGSEDLSAFTKLAVGRIVEKSSDGAIRLDPNFYPTMLSISAAPEIRSFLKELADGVEQRAVQIAGRIGQPEQNGVADVSDFMLLMALNRYGPVLRHMQGLPRLHPEELYKTLVQILGELSTFFDEVKLARDIPAYNHDIPEACWRPLISRLRIMLAATLSANATPITLDRRSRGYTLAPVFETNLLAESEFVLAVKADVPVERVQREFNVLAKASSIETIKDLVQRQLPGIPMRLMPVAPRQLPYHAGYTYFLLDRTSKAWQVMDKSKGFAFHFAGEFPNLELQFWAIRSV